MTYDPRWDLTPEEEREIREGIADVILRVLCRKAAQEAAKEIIGNALLEKALDQEGML